ncbi:hypothetical protein VE01_07925 [Pseudogymnoascus verrucosus]|uniref:Uncharacterized protein n=1 Tax=Pseudogymnoascus verrucosus TaxID=342668 RepID=A0A1B8GFM4_9PEZI|nr:uncharacterized protein VE01_07925 [Pseudogymnoascus verrucosus]OBT94630.1 hypothetical protein VE01_07925 [Pseudogymnoascus verrucosus]
MALQLLRSGLGEDPRRSRALAALLTLPDARHLEFRALVPSDPPNLSRMQNLEAAVGYTVGELVQPPCTDCAAGYGQFAGASGWRDSSWELHELPLRWRRRALLAARFCGPLRARLRARRPAAAAASCAVEVLTGGVGRGSKRAAPPSKDTGPSRRARTLSPARAAAARAPPSRRPDDPYYVGNEDHPTHTLHAWIERFRAASPASRRRLRLGHTLAGVIVPIVPYSPL